MKRGENSMMGDIQHALFLDDERNPNQVTWVSFPAPYYKFDIVRNYLEFVIHVRSLGVPDFVSFDHDLADVHYEAMLRGSSDYGEEKTGYDCAKWLVHYCLEQGHVFPAFTVHSMNPVGKENIEKYIENASKNGLQIRKLV